MAPRRLPLPLLPLLLLALLLLLVLRPPPAAAQHSQQQPQGIEAWYRFPLCLQSAGNECLDPSSSADTPFFGGGFIHDGGSSSQALSAPGGGAVLSVGWDPAREGYVLWRQQAGGAHPEGARLLLLANATAVEAGPSGWHQLAVAAQLPPPSHGPPHQQQQDGGDGGDPQASQTRWLLRAWYAAGLLEGYLTAPLIADYARNIRAAAFDARYPSKELLDFVGENRRWMEETASYRLINMSSSGHSSSGHSSSGHSSSSMDEESDVEAEAWLGAAVVVAQFEGLVSGYQASATGMTKPLTALELFLVNSYGDSFDLEHRFPPEDDPPPELFSNPQGLDTRWFWAPASFSRAEGSTNSESPPRSDARSNKMAAAAATARADSKLDVGFDESLDQDRCTVLLKATPGGDVLAAHATFDYYLAAWQRVIKEVDLPVLTLKKKNARGGGKRAPPLGNGNGNGKEKGAVGRAPAPGNGKANAKGEESGVGVGVGVVGRTRQCFSASAGQVASLDDFYLVRGEGQGSGLEGKRLVITETTTMMKSLRSYLADLFSPHTLLYWVRVSAANAWARDGKHWTQLFAVSNSGTYNSEWMVIDPPNRKLWVLDQAPHRAHAIDRSASLFPFSPPTNTIASPAATSVNKEGTDKHTRRGLAAAGAAFEEEAPPRAGGGVGQGWFGSHNVPSDRDVYDYLGFGLKEPGSLKYQLELFAGAPRGQQLARLQAGVTDVESMKRLIQYDDWEHDPSALGHPLLAIAGRGDLEDRTASNSLYRMEGAIDAKVVSVAEAFGGEHLSLHARVGMATDAGQPPFCWADHPDHTPGVGSPACYDFQWEKLSPGKVLADALQALEDGAKQEGRGGQQRRRLRQGL